MRFYVDVGAPGVLEPSTGKPPGDLAASREPSPIRVNLGTEPEIPQIFALEAENRHGAKPVEGHRFKGPTRRAGQQLRISWVV
jgi:hypothetical protein